jgi:uncharacterized membrane protein YGL010W
MQSFVTQARLYASYHKSKTTWYLHLLGVPIILFSLMVFLGFVHIIVPGVFETNLAVLATLAVLVYYYRLQWKLALALTPIMAILLLLANLFSARGPTKLGLWAFALSFIIGWCLQLYGHFQEKKKPAFMDDLFMTCIAPLYLTATLFFKAGYLQSLQEEIKAH